MSNPYMPAPEVDSSTEPPWEFTFVVLPVLYGVVFLFCIIVPERGTFLEWCRRAHIKELLQHAKPFKAGVEDPEASPSAYECVLCLEDFESGDEVLTLPCGHAFHKDCIHRWLVFTIFQTRTCPVCKRDALRDGLVSCRGFCTGAGRACWAWSSGCGKDGAGCSDCSPGFVPRRRALGAPDGVPVAMPLDSSSSSQCGSSGHATSSVAVQDTFISIVIGPSPAAADRAVLV